MTATNNIVMAGLVPAIHESDEVIIKIIPFGICRENEPHLPLARPMLHVVLALDRRPDVGVRLHLDQPLQPVPLGEPVRDALSMFPYSAPQITGDARIERAIRPIGHDVDPGAFHSTRLRKYASDGNFSVDGRDKPGHDEKQDRVGLLRACSGRY